jgi:hypothetical protein
MVRLMVDSLDLQRFCQGFFFMSFMMRGENSFNQSPGRLPSLIRPADNHLHPAWRAFIEHCADLQHGEIEILKIQDGLPVLAEITRKKIKFAP